MRALMHEGDSYFKCHPQAVLYYDVASYALSGSLCISGPASLTAAQKTRRSTQDTAESNPTNLPPPSTQTRCGTHDTNKERYHSQIAEQNTKYVHLKREHVLSFTQQQLYSPNLNSEQNKAWSYRTHRRKILTWSSTLNMSSYASAEGEGQSLQPDSYQTPANNTSVWGSLWGSLSLSAPTTAVPYNFPRNSHPPNLHTYISGYSPLNRWIEVWEIATVRTNMYNPASVHFQREFLGCGSLGHCQDSLDLWQTDCYEQ